MSRFQHLEFDLPPEEALRAEATYATPSRWLTEADRAFRDGAFERALRHYARAIEGDARCAPGWVGQAQMLVELDEPGEARLWAEKGLDRLPDDASLQAAKAVALARLGDTEGGRVFSDNAMESQGEAPYLWLARGEVLLARREQPFDYCFDRALALGGSDWLWPWLTARALAFHHRFAKSLTRAQQALTLAPGEAVVWTQLALAQTGLGLVDHARHSLDQARELNPHGPESERAGRELRNCGGINRLLGRVRHWLAPRRD